MQIQSYKLFILPIFACVLLSSCSTAPKPAKSRLIERNVAKIPKNRAPIVPKAGAKFSSPADQRKEQALLDLYSKIYVEGSKLPTGGLERIQFLAKKPDATQLEKAIVVIAALEHPIFADQAGRRSLQPRMEMANINLLGEFNSNPYLQPISIADRVLRYFQASLDTPEYKRGFLTAIQNRAQSWTQLWKISSGSSAFESVPSNDETQTITNVETSTPARINPSNYRTGDLKLGDNILTRAKRLAERGDYKGAIAFANRVQPEDPFYPEAQNRVRSFSNLAVQSLRQKAAEAFQSSLPVADAETKAAYLSEAKQYLEQALQDFPKADHLKTVQDNLAVITRDLDTINQDNN